MLGASGSDLSGMGERTARVRAAAARNLAGTQELGSRRKRERRLAIPRAVATGRGTTSGHHGGRQHASAASGTNWARVAAEPAARKTSGDESLGLIQRHGNFGGHQHREG